ncbi:MAG: diadenylate cyclase CdaA [Limnochordia bacterium]|jgi:diadenylate cyclase
MEFSIIDAVDILLVAILIYKLLGLIRGTRAVTLLKGLAVIFLGSALSRWLKLRTISWLLDRGLTVLFVALPVVFYPELRRALEQIGRGELFGRFPTSEKAQGVICREVALAAGWLAKRRIGGLIVLERETGLGEYIETGVRLDALLSHQLLRNIFIPPGPLHDGAAIIREDRIIAASCVLPLTETRILQGELGTRHRAGIGLSEVSDALVVIISEEKGIVSLAVDGQLERGFNEEELERRLWALLHRQE